MAGWFRPTLSADEQAAVLADIASVGVATAKQYPIADLASVGVATTRAFLDSPAPHPARLTPAPGRSSASAAIPNRAPRSAGIPARYLRSPTLRVGITHSDS